MADSHAGVMASLLYADWKTTELYDEAATKVPGSVAGPLRTFLADYAANAERLGELVGEMHPEPTDEVRMLEQDLARVVKEATSEVNVLEALLLAERTNALLFRAADETEPPIEHARLLAKHHEDQQRHTTFMEARLPEARRSAATANSRTITPDVDRMLSVDEKPADSGTTAPDPGPGCIPGMTDDRSPDDFE